MVDESRPASTFWLTVHCALFGREVRLLTQTRQVSWPLRCWESTRSRRDGLSQQVDPCSLVQLRQHQDTETAVLRRVGHRTESAWGEEILEANRRQFGRSDTIASVPQPVWLGRTSLLEQFVV